MQEKYIKINNPQVSEKLSNFVSDELLKNTNVSSENFWLGLEKTLDELAPKNKKLINFREELQKKIADKYGYKLVDHKLELYGIKKK